MYQFKQLSNTRDLGGIKNIYNQTIKEKHLFRSNQLFKASNEELAYLNETIDVIYDFRTTSEVYEKKDPVLSNVTYIHHPIIKDIAAGITRDQSSQNSLQTMMKQVASNPDFASQYMKNLYEQFVLDPYCIKQYQLFLEGLLNKKKILWHCTAGKDRAGFATILILEILQVDRQIIIDDYLKTNDYLKKEIDAIYHQISKHTNYDGLYDVVASFFGAKKAYIDHLYTTIEKHYDNIQNFIVNQLNFDENKQKEVRSFYLS